jgi:hypothetical protein
MGSVSRITAPLPLQRGSIGFVETTEDEKARKHYSKLHSNCGRTLTAAYTYRTKCGQDSYKRVQGALIGFWCGIPGIAG